MDDGAEWSTDQACGGQESAAIDAGSGDGDGLITVAVGVLCGRGEHAGRVLITQRRDDAVLGGCWEFPGGKVEPGEAVVATLRREFAEELGVEVRVGAPIVRREHAYDHGTVALHFFWCELTSGVPQALAAQRLRWVTPTELPNFDFPDANGPVLERVIAALGDVSG